MSSSQFNPCPSGVQDPNQSQGNRSSESSESETEAGVLERAQLSANIRQNRWLIRRAYRRFARLLACCTPERVGAELAIEMQVMFGDPNPQHLLSSDGGSSGDEGADISLLSQCSTVPERNDKRDRDDKDPPKSPSSSVERSIPAS